MALCSNLIEKQQFLLFGKITLLTTQHTTVPGLMFTDSAIQSLVAKNARHYDQLPYISRPFPQTRPAHLAGLARLFKLEPPPVAHARVLELGAAAGGNLIPLAARHPDAQFVGVDLSGVQVAQAQERINQLNLRNIKIEVKDLTDITAEFGEFDYIICHGVYSWVPGPVREAILRICRDNLSPQGLAVVSYNVLPGWRLPQVMRDAFLDTLPVDAPPQERNVRARELASLLVAHCSGTNAYRQVSADWGNRVMNFADDYLGHEFLEQNNEPCTFSTFMNQANAHGLSFLAEAELHTMVLDNMATATAEKVRELTQNALIPTEQIMDVLTGRTFRHTVLVKGAQEPRINRQLSLQSVAGLHLTARANLVIEKLNRGAYVTSEGSLALNTPNNATTAMAQRIAARLPGSSCAHDLVKPGAYMAELQLAQDLIFKMALRGLGALSTEPVVTARSLPERPEVDPLVRQDAARGAAFTANLRHEHASLDALSQLVLPLLDGTRDTEAILEKVSEAVLAGRLDFALDGEQVTDRSEQVKLACGAAQDMLAALHRRAFLLDPAVQLKASRVA
jgi:methyltransferase-like protein/2-polyprenyl-3-methyl-5-hydroxy-6-metoxy-1,4-benzoquinol methylase